MALTQTDQFVLDAMRQFEDAGTLGEQQDVVKIVADAIDKLLDGRSLDEVTTRTCHECKSVIHDGDKWFEDEDGSLCCECYGYLYGKRDRADEQWRAVDFLFDWSRGT
jgi:hypothetical protein